jgi:hypothetical protein
MDLRRTLALLLTVIAMAIASPTLVACGDDNGSGSASSDTPAGETSPDKATGANDEPGTEHGDGARVDGGVQPGGGTTAPQRTAARERKRVDTAVKDVYDSFAGGGKTDAVAICGLMSERARKQTARYVEVASGVKRDWTCAKGVEYLSARVERRGDLGRLERAEVVGVNVVGDRASASVRFGPDGPITTLPLVREEGAWRLDMTPGGGK